MRFEKKVGVQLIMLIATILGIGCASMDLRVDTLRLDDSYGLKPRIAFTEFKHYSGEPDKPYVKLADLVIQETPQVIISRSADAMLNQMCKTAWKNGADALINVTIGTTNVAGAARSSAVVKGTAIRFKE